VSGEEAFHFYKTLGSPLPLILQLGHKHGFKVDVDSFKKIQENEHERSTQVSKQKQTQSQEQ
jgi:alanyl-tRNA synthetase